VDDLHDAAEQRPDRDHEREGGDGFDRSPENDRAERDAENSAEHQGPPGAPVRSLDDVGSHCFLLPRGRGVSRELVKASSADSGAEGHSLLVTTGSA
jgi:hypothetical protein